ncbi:MAG: histidine phosphatase family protein [Steroidobacteraceae bacterium]
MSRIYLVRHGQATFGAEDYDRLTETGVQQCAQLARHWHAIGRSVDRVYAGTLRRQQESAMAFTHALGAAGGAVMAVRTLPGVEEYDHRALLAALNGGNPQPESTDRREFHRRLARALQAWIGGELAGIEDFARFRARCAAGLTALLAETGRGGHAVLFASAGSLAAAMQPALGMGDRELMRLKLTFYNSGVSCLLFDGETLTIESLNAVSHLEHPEFTQLITHR